MDTSCDETSIAILSPQKNLLANIISSQVKLHAPHGGVVPEIASRAHLNNLPWVLNQALQEAGISLSQITGIAVTTSPGLIGCLLVGLTCAKTLAYSLKIPFTTVHHLKAHLFSPFLVHEETYPFLGLVVSGGHTAFYEVKSFGQVKALGQTVDDAAGEAYDKVAKLLGLGYPGGPIIDKLAAEGNPHAFKFTRARVKKGSNYMSFSGLKTAVSLLVKSQKKVTDTFKKDLAASFQREVVETLIEKCTLLLGSSKCLAVSGGVAVNSLLRHRLEEYAAEKNIRLALPPPKLCTDNGAMVAYVGERQLELGELAHWDANALATSALEANHGTN